MPSSERIEASLEAVSQEGKDLGGRAAQIAPGFQQPQGEVLGRTDAFREYLTKQATARHQLTEQMGDSQGKAKDLVAVEFGV